MTMLIRHAVTASPKAFVPVTVVDGAKPGSAPLTPKQVEAGSDQVMKTAVRNASTVMSFLQTAYGRDGLDGKGMPLEIVVHAPDPSFGGSMSNAYWDVQAGKMYLGDGDGGKEFTPLGNAADVIAHEAGHAILDSEVKLGFRGQEGALHESFGDVIASMVDADDWKIGEDAFTPGIKGDALRDMANPSKYKHMDQVKGAVEPHQLADIPNLAAVRAAEKIGRQEMGKVWYTGFTEHMRDNGKFTDAAAATVKAAELLFGAGSTQVAAVTDAWTSVGVLLTATKAA